MPILFPDLTARGQIILLDQTLKAALKEVFIGVANMTGWTAPLPQWWTINDTRVRARFLLNLRAGNWNAILSQLRSLTNDEVINGFMITRRRRRQRPGSGSKELFFDYSILGFKSRETGDAEINSEDQLNAYVEAVDETLDFNPTLGLDSDLEQIGFQVLGFESDSGPGGWQVSNIDLVGNDYHILQSELTVHVTKVTITP